MAPYAAPSFLLVVLTMGALTLGACVAHTPAKTATFKAQPLAGAPVITFNWRTKLRSKLHWSYKPLEYSAPVHVDTHNSLIVGTSDGDLVRMNAGNGEVLWRVKLLDRDGSVMPIHADVAVANNVVYVGTLHGSVHAFKLSDGSSLWEYRAEDAVEGAVVFAEGRLLFTDAREILHTLDASTGKLLWRYQRPAPESFTIKGGGVPVVDAGAVFCGFADGTLAALQLDSGEVLWTVALGGDATEFMDVDLPVILDGASLYATSYSGGIHSVNPVDGSIKWTAPISSVSSVIKKGDVLYAASAQGRVVALETKNRQPIWSFKYKSQTPVHVREKGPYLFVSTSDGPLSVLDRTSGYPLSNWNPSGGFMAPVLFTENKGYSFSNGGYMYSFNVAYAK